MFTEIAVVTEVSQTRTIMLNVTWYIFAAARKDTKVRTAKWR